jgi:ABC-type uncharacterized transport system permease subunit
MMLGKFELRLEQRTDVRRSSAIIVPTVAILGALIIGGIFLMLTGHPALSVYQELAKTGYGNWYGVTDTLSVATPLIFTGLAAAFAFRMNLYNIGGEGQLYAGAIGASWAGLAIAPHVSGSIAVIAVLLAGMLGGAFWILIPALARALFKASEIVTTLLFNYVALFLIQFLILGSASFWRDPNSKNFPQGLEIPKSAHFPVLHLSLIHI